MRKRKPPAPLFKSCGDCGVLPPAKGGRDCSECRNAKQRKAYRASAVERKPLAVNLWRLYRLRLEDYDRMREEQDHRCALCGIHENDAFTPGDPRHKAATPRLCVDHDHRTGRPRALLCHHCNRLIGIVEANLARMEQLQAYVVLWNERHRDMPTIPRKARPPQQRKTKAYLEAERHEDSLFASSPLHKIMG